MEGPGGRAGRPPNLCLPCHVMAPAETAPVPRALLGRPRGHSPFPEPHIRAGPHAREPGSPRADPAPRCVLGCVKAGIASSVSQAVRAGSVPSASCPPSAPHRAMCASPQAQKRRSQGTLHWNPTALAGITVSSLRCLFRCRAGRSEQSGLARGSEPAALWSVWEKPSPPCFGPPQRPPARRAPANTRASSGVWLFET